MGLMEQRKRVWGLGLAAGITALAWQLPLGRYILYPLTILATWFHEMAHGLTALLLGGHFHRLDLLPDGSGLAVYSGDLFFGEIGKALVAGAGPIGPALAGSVLILSSVRAQRSTRVLVFLSCIMMVSAALWLRTLFGVVFISLMAFVLLWMALKGSHNLRGWTVQLLGINASISIFMQMDYLFSYRAIVSGREFYSDTGQMANALFLPYWFWAILILFLAVLLPFLSLRRAVRL